MPDTMPAAEQQRQMREALDQLEVDLLAAADNPTQFEALRARRDAMQREVTRLGYLEQRQAREAAAAHLRALRDRLHEACDVAARLRGEGAAIDAEIGLLLAQFEGLLARAAQLTREHRACAARADNAATALRRAGEVPQRSGVGDWRCPGQDAALALWVTA